MREKCEMCDSPFPKYALTRKDERQLTLCLGCLLESAVFDVSMRAVRHSIEMGYIKGGENDPTGDEK